MRKGISAREKIMLGVLAIIAVFALYYYFFLTPISEKIVSYKEDSLSVEDQLLIAEVKVTKMNKMEKELEQILSGETDALKELPAYDNSRNVMNYLSSILHASTQYDVKFSTVSEEDGIVRRNIDLDYVCNDYETAKSILSQIHDGEYRCLLGNMSLSRSGLSYRVSVEITYFEYVP